MTPLERRADRLFSRFIRERDGVCQIGGIHGGNYIHGVTVWAECWGTLECAHLLRRSFKATRWEPLNAVALCQGHHGYMTDHPLAWNAWREERLGGAAFAALLGQAMHGARPDVRAIVEDLERRLEAA